MAHVWRIPLSLSRVELVERAGVLSADELSRASRFVFRKDREQYVGTRSAVRILLSQYLRQSPRTLEFTYGKHGKPELEVPRGAGTIGFNVAHAGVWALCAVAPTFDVGVDVERLRSDVDLAGATFVFAASELKALEQQASVARPETFFHFWTQKEAYVKAVGDGLAIPLNSFEVETGSSVGIKSICGSGEEADEWVMQVADPAPGYFGVVALRGTDWKVDFFDAQGIDGREPGKQSCVANS